MDKTKSAEKKKVFLASSKKALDSQLLEPIALTLQKNGFDPKPWNREFPTGHIIIDELFRITSEHDFAIFVFAEDITIVRKNGKSYGTAWNVVLECGMFLQKVGLTRACIIHYGASEIPSDLGGLIVAKINPESGIDITTQIEAEVEKLCDQWKNYAHDLHGVNQPLSEHKNKLEDIIKSMQAPNALHNPIEFDEEVIIDLYVGGLEKVQNRFLTTTFLSSGFWTHKTNRIVQANLDMLAKLKHSQSNGESTVKRIFLLRREFDEEVAILRKKLIDYKSRKSGEADFKKLRNDFLGLKRACEEFQDYNCQIRYVHDRNSISSILDDYIDPEDTEIAIYDDFRIDFFSGGRKRKITAVNVVTNKHTGFIQLKRNVEKYFTSLWEEAHDIEPLLHQYQRIFDYYEKRVDYSFSKLIALDYELPPRDMLLKNEELAAVKNHIRNWKFKSTVRNYLDIGTCTGRYPIELRDSLQDSCAIYGFDSDHDCIMYTQAKLKLLKQIGKSGQNIQLIQGDLLLKNNALNRSNRRYDLITCMLGTVSHFGWDRSDDFDDSLQTALMQMCSLLTENGTLIISNWSLDNVDSDFFTIYNSREIELLRAGTESLDRLQKRLDLLSMNCTFQSIGNERLDILYCTNKH